MTIGRKVALGLVVVDTIALATVLNGMAWARGILAFGGPIVEPLIIPLAALGIALYLIDGYKLHTDMLSLDYASQHSIALIAAMGGTLLLTFVVIPSGYPLQQSRSVVALTFLVLIPVTLAYRRWLYGRFQAARRERSIVFIGDPASAATFREEWARAGMQQPLIFATGQTGNTAPGIDAPAVPLPFSEILSWMRKGQLAVEAIVLRESNREVTAEMSQQLVDLYFGGIPTYTLELFHQVYWRKIPLYRLNQTWLFQEGFRTAREPVFDRLKRVSDIVLSLVGLVVFSPILLLAAIAVWTEDRGTVFYIQTRIGKFRQPFRLYKFRTMRPSSEGGPYAQPGDLRVTRVGRLLRASRLDELPQLLNVLRGEMSLIGPRAEWDKLVAEYEQKIPSYHFRHLVRPGITGWAQVNYTYGSSVEDTLRKLEYDLYYIRHFSFTLDASIVLKTIHVMLFGKGR
ncbi:polyprenyl glycosylphosphotransferase [Opitutaceae bacterium EW11]|nr:polyprenyl glycosylphosphotransferase [Opitutaceae bacterium EW11]